MAPASARCHSGLRRRHGFRRRRANPGGRRAASQPSAISATPSARATTPSRQPTCATCAAASALRPRPTWCSRSATSCRAPLPPFWRSPSPVTASSCMCRTIRPFARRSPPPAAGSCRCACATPAAVTCSIRTRCDRWQTADTRIILLCNPQNPTGRVFSREELQAIAQLAVERDLIVVSDEIHCDLVYPGHAHIPFVSLGARDRRAHHHAQLRDQELQHSGPALRADAFRQRRPARAFPQARAGAAARPARRHRHRCDDRRLGRVPALARCGDGASRPGPPPRDRCAGEGDPGNPLSICPRRRTSPGSTAARCRCSRRRRSSSFSTRRRSASAPAKPSSRRRRSSCGMNFATSRVILDEILGRMIKAVKAR